MIEAERVQIKEKRGVELFFNYISTAMPYVLAFVFIFSSHLLAFSTHAYSQDDQDASITTHGFPPLTSYENEISWKEFEEDSELYDETPLDMDYLRFKVRLPLDWIKMEKFDQDYVDPTWDERRNTFIVDDKYLKRVDRERKTAEKLEQIVSQREARQDPEKYGDKKEEVKEGSNLDELNEKMVVGSLATFFGPSNLYNRSYMEIFAVPLNYKITTKNWFLDYVFNNTLTVIGLDEVNDNRVEAMYIKVEKEISYIVRVAAIKNGRTMFLIRYLVPDRNFNKERAQQQHAIESFEFTDPLNIKMETERTYSFLDMIFFEYPLEWRLIAPNIYSLDSMDAQLVTTTEDEQLKGEIFINILSTDVATDIAEDVNYMRNRMHKRGLEVTDLMEVRDGYDFGEYIKFNRVEVYSAVDAKPKDRVHILDHEFWLAVLQEENYIFFVSLLSPSRNNNFIDWAKNIEAFETVIESLRP